MQINPTTIDQLVSGGTPAAVAQAAMDAVENAKDLQAQQK